MPRILIVDDEAENLKSLKRYLEDSAPGWTISTAQNEAEARSTFTDLPPDVVITDLVMKTEESGMNILRDAKTRDPLVMVIVITAYEKKLDRYRAFELGAFDCVQKNMPGVIAAEEILVKTRAALHFRQLAREQIENQKRISFLSRYFDPRVFEMIEKNPDLLNISGRTLTICFWDIRGFSMLCEVLKAHPTLLSGFLREYFQIAADAIFQNNGVLDKFIGDGVMGLFGALNHTDAEGRQDAANAVNAALALRLKFGDLMVKWTDQWKLYTPQSIEIGLGCGIHTGEALVGNVGTETRDQYTALGPHVNFAQRLESRAIKGQILVSASTEIRINGKFETDDVGVINDVKNVPGEFRIFAVKPAV